MGATLDKIKESTVWDKNYNLPTIPRHNNGHIYCAYVTLILEKLGENTSDIRASYIDFFNKCQLPNGTFSRWPGGRGGDTSHDEIMGAAYMNDVFARSLIDYLTKMDGQFSVEKQEQYNERRNQFRFVRLMLFMKACAGYRVSLFSQAAWGLYALYNAATWKGDCSGTLKVWLTLDRMKEYPLSAFFGFIWKLWMEKKHKITPKIIFTKYYLTEEPVLGQIALDSF